MKNNKIVDDMMSSTKIKNLGLKRESLEEILDIYSQCLVNNLLENGYIQLDNGFNIEVVLLLDRVHVLRGIQYKSNRKYKLKLTMEENIYKQIESYYDKLKEDIL